MNTGFPYEFPILLYSHHRGDTKRQIWGVQQYPADTLRKIRIFLEALNFALEIRDDTGKLLAILQDAHNIVYSLQENIPMLDFDLPADNDKTAYLARDREIWLRNMRTGDVMAKFRPGTQKERR